MHPLVEKYFRVDRLPHIWCPGCGIGTAVFTLVRAIDRAGLDQDKTAIVSGIGCSSRAPGYLDFDTLHTTHGRALAFATGLKLARPELKVIVLSGDGDLAAIGGNHFIHAARRNIDLTTVCLNNSIYGMTGGQHSPLTPRGKMASTTPYGNADRGFDLCALAQAAGATYVARSTTFHVERLCELMRRALLHRGFSFVEVACQCPTYYGRRNGLRTAAEMLSSFQRRAVSVERARELGPGELEERLLVGEIYSSEAPEFVEEYRRLMERSEEGAALDGAV
ncbi:MAG: 2-oxoacid:ferredoxin oxidoreductase subunit beta [Acetobacteraceae bacterium]|nr:2-oxoacid:ferredoxin oxidoreductase subunit beta [Acetobacteraceae bacterium]